MTELKSEFSRKAVTDLLLRITGVADYLVIILIPELAVILIKKDIRIYNKEARRILQESIYFKRILYKDSFEV